MKPILHHICSLIILPVLLAGSAGAAERTFRWVDDNGQVHYGDRVPPQYVNKERQEINGQGRLVKIYEAQKTPEEKARDQRLAALAEAREKAVEQQHRHDQTLLATYSSEQDMLMARDGTVAAIETLIQLTDQRIASMEKRLRKLTEEAAEYERSGKKLPMGLVDQITDIRKQISRNEQFVRKKEQEKTATVRQFEADIRRFRNLTSAGKSVATSDPEPVQEEFPGAEMLPPSPIAARLMRSAGKP